MPGASAVNSVTVLPSASSNSLVVLVSPTARTEMSVVFGDLEAEVIHIRCGGDVPLLALPQSAGAWRVAVVSPGSVTVVTCRL